MKLPCLKDDHTQNWNFTQLRSPLISVEAASAFSNAKIRNKNCVFAKITTAAMWVLTSTVRSTCIEKLYCFWVVVCFTLESPATTGLHLQFFSPTVKTPEWSCRIEHFTIASTGIMVSRVVSRNMLKFHKLNYPFNVPPDTSHLYAVPFLERFSPQSYISVTQSESVWHWVAVFLFDAEKLGFSESPVLRGGPSSMICDITNTVKA